MSEPIKRKTSLTVIRNGREEIIEAEIEEEELPEGKRRQLELIDLAAKGNIEAAAALAEGYLTGAFDGTVHPEKGRKWARYAAKKGSQKAADLLQRYFGS